MNPPSANAPDADRGVRSGGADSDRKSARTRRRILESAALVLRRRGYAGTRLTEIADTAELRLPAIYYYFATREDLISEVVRTGVRRTHENVRAALDALDPAALPLDRISAAAAAHLEMVLEEGPAGAAMRTVTQLPPPLRNAGRLEERRYGELWRDLFSDAARSGDLDPDLDARGARMLVLGALNWATDWWDPARGTVAGIQGTARRLVRNALAAPRAEG